MKQLKTILAAVVFFSLSAYADIDWNSVTNLVDRNVASVQLSSNDSDEAKRSIIDNNNGSGWQATASAHKTSTIIDGQEVYANDWILLDLGSEMQFTDIETIWERSHPSLYSIYTSVNPIPYESINFAKEGQEDIFYNIISPSWLETNNPIAYGESDDNDNSVTISTNFDVVTARYILIYVTGYNGWADGYGSRLFEIRVANIEGREDINTLTINVESPISTDLEYKVNIGALNNANEVVTIDFLEDINLTSNSPDIISITEDVEKGSFKISSKKVGQYQLFATAKFNDIEVNGSTYLIVANLAHSSNIAQGKAILARIKPDEDTQGHGYEAATDGNEDTYYVYNGEWEGGDSWIVVDLEAEHAVDQIVVSYGDKSNGSYKIYFGNEFKLQDDANLDTKWENLGLAEWKSTSSLNRQNNALNYYFPESGMSCRYVAIVDGNNPGGKPQVKEIYITGQEYKDAVASDIVLSFDPVALLTTEPGDLSVVVKDQFGVDFIPETDPVITLSGVDAVYENGKVIASSPGDLTIKATLGDITSEITIPVFDIDGYCLDGAIVTSDNPDLDGNSAIDGGKDPKELGRDYQLVQNGVEPAGEYEHWILAKLNRKYNLDIIEAIWEGACPRDYDVYVGETEEDLQKLYSVTGHTQKTWYDRFFGEEMNNVRYIKIVTTYNATGYGIKLYDLKAYGQVVNDSYPDKVELELLHNFIVAEEPVSFSATVYDQYGFEIPNAEVKYYLNDEDEIENNKPIDKIVPSATPYDIVAKSGSVSSEPKALLVVASDKGPVNTENDVTIDGESTSLTAGNFYLGNDNDGFKSMVITFKEPIDLGYMRLNWSESYPTSYTVTAKFAPKNTRAAGDDEKTLLTVNREYDGSLAPIDRIFQQGVQGTSFLVGNNALCGNSDMKQVSVLTITPTASTGNAENVVLKGVDLYDTSNSVMTGVQAVTVVESEGPVNVYNVNGILIRKNVERGDALRDLPAGLYIVGGKKVLVK